MQPFQFKLDGLLKIRRSKEDQIKIKLGQILKEINNVKQEMITIEHDLDAAYDLMVYGPDTESERMFTREYPMYIERLKEDLEIKSNLLYALGKKYQEIVVNMKKAKAEVEILENFRDKKLTSYKKLKNKKDEQKLEDILIMRRRLKELWEIYYLL